MIARITGVLAEVTETAALVDTGAGVWYELLVPAFELERLRRRMGQEVGLHTIHYFEGDPSHGVQTPRLIGFTHEDDRDFFRLFTTVKGIGMRRALRAMIRPVSEVAAAIANKDAKFLVMLPEIGKRTAEQIIAELSGKIDQFAAATTAGGPPAAEVLPEPATEALAVLVQLGERRADALALIERVLAVAPELKAPEDIIAQVYRLKAGG